VTPARQKGGQEADGQDPIGADGSQPRARHVLVVPREAAGSRVDRFLVTALAATAEAPSRAELQRWIERGRVTVAGKAKKAADKLRAGEAVEVLPDAPARTRAVPDGDVRFSVLYMDDAIVVVDKPPGLVVHPARGHESGTLVNGLLALGAFDATALRSDDQEADAAGHVRPGIVHRIDKGTSGILVVARTAAAREKLKAQFAAHTIGREYEAICVGAVRTQTFSTMHGRHPTDRLRFTTKLVSGKRAITHVKAVRALAGGAATHVTCALETGRTHQIRVHLAETGTPILGDPLYGKPPKDARLRAVADALGHQALHARLLAFVHPTTGATMRFEAPVPADFAEALRALGEPTA
jgi:23S rRNA pseudouridine1911/1915/1917 synthase